MKRINGRTLVLICVVALLAATAMMLSGRKQNVHAEKKNIVNEPAEQFVPGRVLVKFHDDIQPAHARNIIAALGARDASEIPNIGVHILDLPYQANEKAFVSAFQAQSEVEFAELDRIVEPADITPNDPWYANWEWHLKKIQAPTAWSTTTGNSAIVIAILDTGVDGTHEDLVSQMVPGWNIYNNNSDTSDIYGHGTVVAGTAGAASNNGIGVASVAWGCKIMPVRISAADGTASYSAMASGLNWAADHGARIANISYVATDSSTVKSAAQYFQSKGGVVTVAAGNQGTFDSSSDNPYVLTIGATNSSDVLYSWSNTGNNVDISAPGSVISTERGGGYNTDAGTSVAAPIVAGVAALVMSVNPSLTASQVQDILKKSADDLGPAGWDPSYGWGRINAARAVAMAGGSTTTDDTPPIVSISSPSDGTTVSGTVAITVAASDNVSVASVSISVDGSPFTTDTVAPYSFSWDTRAWTNVGHTLTATAADSAGNIANASITVTVSNTTDSTAPGITITSPGNSATVSGMVSIYVNASDNVGVVKVESYVDGKLNGTSTSAPFTNKWNTAKATKGSHTLQCKAYDAAGNVGVSQIETVYK